MAESAVRKIMDLGAEIPNLAASKKAVVSAVEDCVGAARRAVKRGRFAAEDLMDEATHTVKQRPLQTVALTFGLAFGAGALLAGSLQEVARSSLHGSVKPQRRCYIKEGHFHVPESA